MPAAHHFGSGSGPRAGAGKVYRGSRKRVRRIKWRENTTVEFWICILFVLIMLFVGIPWLMRHPPEAHHYHLVDE
jgi:uncharacterized iron-regulated membrane protein